MDEDTGPLSAERVGLFEEILNSGAGLRVKVTGRSMAPFLKGSEVLTIKKVPCSALRPGDLLFFKNGQDSYVLHRLVRKKRGRIGASIFQTKGDALAACDVPVTYNEILGKVFKIEKTRRKLGFGQGTVCLNMESPWQMTLNYLIAMAGLVRSNVRFLLWRIAGNINTIGRSS